MKNIKIIKLSYRNFKGQNKDFDFNGESVKILGDNGTGKTTVADAFYWLLFDKDSQSNSKFQIKNVDGNGKEINNLQHAVKSVLSVDGKIIELMKVYKEKWTTPNGSIEKLFGGHTVDYYINEVKTKKKDYQSKVDEIVNEDTFKLLTNPEYFAKQLKWQDARKELFKLIEGVDDKELIASQNDLKPLLSDLENKSIEDLKSILLSRKKAIKEELEQLPARIDEVRNMMPVESEDNSNLIKELNELDSQINELEKQKKEVSNGTALLEKEQELKKVEFERDNYWNEFLNEYNNELNRSRVRIEEINGNIQLFQQQKSNEINKTVSINNEIESLKQHIKNKEESIVFLRSKYKTIENEQFECESECPTCKQSLPGEKLEESKRLFTENKNEKLSEIIEQAKENKEFIESSNKKILELQESLHEVNSKISEIDKKIEEAQKEKEKFESKIIEKPDLIEDKKNIELTEKVISLNRQIKQIKEMENEVIEDLDKELKQLHEKRHELGNKVQMFESKKVFEDRIKELTEKQQENVKVFDEIEYKLNLIEQFTRLKVNILTDKVNAKFKLVNFKLFENQVNGGLNECCKITVNGVTYGEGLNSAAMINAGLDIINTLSNHYQINAPIFIDNAETVTKLIDVNSQTIKLVVSENDKELKIREEDKSYAKTSNYFN